MREEIGTDDPEFFRIWWQSGSRRRRVFNDPAQVDRL